MNIPENLIGQKFGKLTVIEQSPYVKNTGAKWLCICECGGQTIAKSNNLKNGNTVSCGCVRKEQMKITGKKNKKDWGEATTRIVFTNYKINCRKRQLEFGLSLEEFKEIIFKNCTYCGKSPSTLRYHPKCYGHIYYNGIDRVNNKKGYVLENCVPCCIICNRGKHAYLYEEWMQHLDALVKYRNMLDKRK